MRKVAHRTDAQRKKHADYMRKWHLKGGQGYQSKDISSDMLARMRREENRGMKYGIIVNERTNPGKSYAEYVAERKAKDAPMRKERLKMLKAERAERIKRCGRIVIKKTTPSEWTRFGMKLTSF